MVRILRMARAPLPVTMLSKRRGMPIIIVIFTSLIADLFIFYRDVAEEDGSLSSREKLVSGWLLSLVKRHYMTPNSVDRLRLLFESNRDLVFLLDPRNPRRDALRCET